MFAGSARKESVNRKLIGTIEQYASKRGVEVTILNLVDYKLPTYDGDFEDTNGPPENANKPHQLIHTHDALLIASPEYNGLP